MANSEHMASAAWAAVAPVWDPVYAILSPMWVEVGFLLCFALGFFVLRVDLIKTQSPKKQKKLVDDVPSPRPFDPRLRRAVEEEEKPAAVLAAWRAGKDFAPTPLELLKAVVQALVAQEPEKLVQHVIGHIRKHSVAMGNSRAVVVVLDVVARAGLVEEMKELDRIFRQDLLIAPTLQTYEVLLGGFATAGDERRVAELAAEMASSRIRMSARAMSLTIKGFLKNSMVDAVIQKFGEMVKLGFQVPPFAVTQLFRIACDAHRVGEAFDAIVGVTPLSPEAVAFVLEDCVKRSDLDLAVRAERRGREEGVALQVGAYDALLKLHTVRGDARALDLFMEMQANNIRISEGLCVGLLARCAEAKYLRFAEEIIKFCRARDGMSISVYSALMKVYAYCNMYSEACDLYDRILEDGLQPDSMMYGCLMKFAVECGRTQLSQKLSEVAPSLDIQNYMSLIRAAGRDRDVDRAFAVLARLKSSGVHIDIAAYNCVLDVCVSAGDMDRARGLVKDMRASKHVDIITYNTLLKGYTAKADVRGAKELLVEMSAQGLRPNDVSYNCLINAAVSAGGGNFREAWDTIDMMEKNGVAVDHYTLSIMMKALKRVKNQRDVTRTLALLDRSGIDVFSDEILLNSVLETCTRHRELRRLEGILAGYHAAAFRPSVHTYGSLIKAASTLKRLPQCWEFWHDMEDRRGMQPNDIVLGCMLDALITNQQVEQAVQLLDKWKDRVPPNTVMYSTIIKGFANTHQSERAMTTWRSMRKDGLKLNTVVYNAVIDAQARVGAMDSVVEVLAAMESDDIKPDVISHSTIVKGYCMKGDMDKAFEVFRDMQRNNLVHDSIVYNTILDGCTRNNRFDLADIILEDMERREVVPSNFTMGILVKMLGRRHMLDVAFERYETLPKRHGFIPNAQVKTCLICACLNNNALDRAFAVFDDLLRTNKTADGKAFGAMISGCVRLGQLDKAVSLVEEACGLSGKPPQLTRGQSLEADCLEKLLLALSQRGQAEDIAIPLLDRLRAAKAPINGRLQASVLSGDGGGAAAARAKEASRRHCRR